MVWDYGAFPLWNAPSNEPPVDLRTLPLSKELRDELQSWSDEGTDMAWGERLPGSPRTRPPSELARRAWEAKGRDLLSRVREELGPDIVVEASQLSAFSTQ
jgi:hypothetical protein